MKHIVQGFLFLVSSNLLAASIASTSSFADVKTCYILAVSGSITITGAPKGSNDITVRNHEKAGMDASITEIIGEKVVRVCQTAQGTGGITVTLPAGSHLTVILSNEASAAIKNLKDCDLYAAMINGGSYKISGCSGGLLTFKGYGAGSLHFSKDNTWDSKDIDLCGKISATTEPNESGGFSWNGGAFSARGGAQMKSGNNIMGSTGTTLFADYNYTPYTVDDLVTLWRDYAADAQTIHKMKSLNVEKDYVEILSLASGLTSFIGKINTYGAVTDASYMCVKHNDHAAIEQGLAACKSIPSYVKEDRTGQTIIMIYGKYFFDQKQYLRAAELWGSIRVDDYSNFKTAEENLIAVTEILAKTPETRQTAEKVAQYLRKPENVTKAEKLLSNTEKPQLNTARTENARTRSHNTAYTQDTEDTKVESSKNYARLALAATVAAAPAAFLLAKHRKSKGMWATAGIATLVAAFADRALKKYYAENRVQGQKEYERIEQLLKAEEAKEARFRNNMTIAKLHNELADLEEVKDNDGTDMRFLSALSIVLGSLVATKTLMTK